MGRLRITGGIVLPMTSPLEPIYGGVVVVEDGQIAYVGEMPGPAKEDGEEVIDATGCVVMPGLISAHTHVSMTLMRGYADDMALQPWLEQKIWPAEMKLRREDVYWGAMLGIAEFLRGGVTCFNDMYHYFDAVAEAAMDAGIRACVSGVLLGILPTAEEDMRRAVEFTAELRQRGDDLVIPMLAPHAPYTCPDPMLERLTEAAIELDVAIHIHLSETRKEVEDSLAEHGRTPVQHLDDIGLFRARTVAIHCVHLTDEDIDILASRGVGVVHCPTSNMKLASGFSPVHKLLEAGVKVGLGTDGPASNNNLNMFEEMMMAATIAKGHTGDPQVVRAEQALVMATRGAAEALGIDHLVGTLEVGKRADIIVIDTARPHWQPMHNIVSHLVYSAQAADVRDVIVDGRVVVRNRQFVALDEAEIVARAAECARRICG